MMARKADRRFLLDTSAVIYRLHGHTLQRAAVEKAVAAEENKGEKRKSER